MNRKDKIKIIGAVSAAVIISTLSIGLSLAYLGDTENKENKQTVTHGDVDISEVKDEPSELSMVNEPLKKEYYVKNTGTVTSFARLYAEFSDSEIAKHIKVKPTDSDEEVPVLWSEFKEKMKKDGEYHSEDWEYIESDTENPELGGYFYYKKPLAPDESTPALINSVILDYQKYDENSVVVDGSNIDRITDIEKIVYAELIQTVETGYKTVNGEEIYGYDYASVPDPNFTPNQENPDSTAPIIAQWKEAWISFLRKVN